MTAPSLPASHSFPNGLGYVGRSFPDDAPEYGSTHRVLALQIRKIEVRTSAPDGDFTKPFTRVMKLSFVDKSFADLEMCEADIKQGDEATPLPGDYFVKDVDSTLKALSRKSFEADFIRLKLQGPVKEAALSEEVTKAVKKETERCLNICESSNCLRTAARLIEDGFSTARPEGALWRPFGEDYIQTPRDLLAEAANALMGVVWKGGAADLRQRIQKYLADPMAPRAESMPQAKKP